MKPAPHDQRAVTLALGWVLLLLALADLGYELYRAAASDDGYRMISAAELWFTLDVASLNLVQAVIQRFIHPYLWQPMLTGLLSWPVWSLFGAPGLLLVILLSPRPSAASRPGGA